MNYPQALSVAIDSMSKYEPRSTTHRRRDALVIGVAILVMSVVYALAMFRGLEPHPAYAGNAYFAIHPGSFPRDPFLFLGKPNMVSLYYRLVSIVGDWWLDDRFTMLVFVVMTAASLIGLDKTVRLFGARHVLERLALMALLLLEHRILDNHAILVDNYEFNPTAFAAPFIIWLLYASLAGSRLWVVLPLVAVSCGLSLKNGWLPAVIALVLLWDRLGPKARRLAGIGLLGVLIAGFATYYAAFRPADGTHVKLFDYIVRQLDNSEANPFLCPLINNLVFLALCGAGVMVRGLPAAVQPRARTVAGLGLAAWLFGGLYLSYAPDAIKIPHLVLFDVTRGLCWPQYVIYVALGVSLLKSLQAARSPWLAISSWAALMTLYVWHLEIRIKLIAMIAVATLALLLFQWLRRAQSGSSRPAQWMERWTPGVRLQLAALAMVVGTLSLYIIGTIHHRLKALGVLMRQGVMGDNGTAKWIGVDTYLRRRTSPSATVLALALDRSGALELDETLRTRSGRSIPVGHPSAFALDYAKLQWWFGQEAHATQLTKAWTRHDAAGVVQHLSALGSPDYLVVPNGQAQWLLETTAFPYHHEVTLSQFTILRND